MKQRSKRGCARWAAMFTVVAAGAFPCRTWAQGSAASGSTTATALSLERALQLAFEQSPRLRAAQATLDEAKGARATAETYPHNPSVRAQVAAREAPDQRTTDYRFWLSQQLELAGQRRDRRAAAGAELAAQGERLARTRRLLAARVHLSLVRALEARDLVEVARTDVRLVQRLHAVARQRLERGAGTRLDVNVTAAGLGRAEARTQSTLARYHARCAALAEATGLGAAAQVVPEGALQTELAPPPPVGQLVRQAREHRADLRALRDLERASSARVELARAQAWPDLTVGAFAGREEGDDRLLGGRLSFALPLFDRNQGPIQQARAAERRTRAERQAGELAVEREVVAAVARYEAGVRSAARLRELVLGTLEQNLELLQRSFEAGKATWPEVVVIRRTLVEAQRELIAAEASARRAWIELQLAAGSMPVPTGVVREEAP